MHIKETWIKDLPNHLTLFRIAVCPALLFLYPIELESLKIFCAFVFMLGGLSDWADGYRQNYYW